MGLTVYHVNIRNWNKNKYPLSIDIHNYNPEIILLNETGLNPLDFPYLQGFSTVAKSNGQYKGVAILIKRTINYEPIILNDENSVAVKIYTNLGPLVISTNYCPPSQNYIPTTSLNHVLSHKLPTLIISDFNAHHSKFDNSSIHNWNGDSRGKALYSLSTSKQLDFLGPYFSTYVVNNRRGKPDLIFGNKYLKPFHHLIEPGNSIGSDHIPIILRLSTCPFKIPFEPKQNPNKLNILEYKNSLSSLPVTSLDNKPVSEVDVVTDTLISTINKAADEHTPTFSTMEVKQYTPTPKIKRLLRKYQAASMNYLRFGYPSRAKLSEFLHDLITEIKLDKGQHWKRLVQEAIDNFGDPKSFWNKVNKLLATKSKPSTQKLKVIHPDNSSTFITNKQDMANLMSSTWEKVFQEHTGPEFENDNVNKVNEWFENIENDLQHTDVISFDTLIPDHPLI